MKIVWRFFSDQEGVWRWQQMCMAGSVISESRSGYLTYDDCLAGARECGYTYEASQPGLPRSVRGRFFDPGAKFAE